MVQARATWFEPNLDCLFLSYEMFFVDRFLFLVFFLFDFHSTSVRTSEHTNLRQGFTGSNEYAIGDLDGPESRGSFGRIAGV